MTRTAPLRRARQRPGPEAGQVPSKRQAIGQRPSPPQADPPLRARQRTAPPSTSAAALGQPPTHEMQGQPLPRVDEQARPPCAVPGPPPLDQSPPPPLALEQAAAPPPPPPRHPKHVGITPVDAAIVGDRAEAPTPIQAPNTPRAFAISDDESATPPCLRDQEVDRASACFLQERAAEVERLRGSLIAYFTEPLLQPVDDLRIQALPTPCEILLIESVLRALGSARDTMRDLASHMNLAPEVRSRAWPSARPPSNDTPRRDTRRRRGPARGHDLSPSGGPVQLRPVSLI